MTPEEAKRFRERIGTAIILMLVVLVAFFAFTQYSLQRINNTNAEYAQSTAQQVSRSLESEMSSALNTVRVAAQTQGATDENGHVSAADLKNIQENTLFSNYAFICADGESYNMDGESIEHSAEDISTIISRAEGGESGIIATDHVYADGTVGDAELFFYAPFEYDGKVTGALVGICGLDVIADMLSVEVFETEVKPLICDTGGNVVCGDKSGIGGAANINEFIASLGAESAAAEAFASAMGSGQDACVSADASEGGNYIICSTSLGMSDWQLVFMLTPQITKPILDSANTSSHILLGFILVIYAVYITILFLRGDRVAYRLTKEKRVARAIAAATTDLFDRCTLLDLEKDRYEIMKGAKGEGVVPKKGEIDVLRTWWLQHAEDEHSRLLATNLLSRRYLMEYLHKGMPYLRFESNIMAADGTACWIQVSALGIEFDKRGDVVKVLLAEQDVNDIKEYEINTQKALKEAYNAAESASKAKSDFLNSMSHDIRTPMNSIVGLTAIASMNADDPDRVRDCLGKITTSSAHLLSLINEVLDMAKIESGKIVLAEEEFMLSDAVQSLATIIQPQIKSKGLELKVDLKGVEHEHLIGDVMRLQQVFVNIMGNAVKFTDAGGTVGLLITEKPSNVLGSACFEFRFSDTGVGMSEEFLQKVFEPFSRANDTRTAKTEGAGLGLAIVKSIVTLMNGQIEVESELGVGTTFIVTVFMKVADTQSEDLSYLKGLSVLVADDDEVSCEYAAQTLKSIGMSAEYVLSGEEAVARAVARHEQADDFTVIILDWKMPGKDGIATAAEIRERVGNEVPIIILSAYDVSMIEVEARAAGINAFISKPLFRSRLVRVLGEALGHDASTAASSLEDLAQTNYAGYRILYVEDNELSAEITQQILGVTGVAVERAEDGKQALDMVLAADAGYYDLVLMDIQMPVMNGYEASTAIRAEAEKGRPDLAQLPIVALTADAFNDDVKRAEAAGMNAHLAKPMEFGKLAEVLAEYLV